MGEKADLHTHTHFSDGTLSPYELLKKAKALGLTTIAITDHDSVAALAAGEEQGHQLGIDVIPGVELSSMVGEREIHILGYFLDHTNRQLLDYLAFFRYERLKRAERIIEKLNSIQVPLTLEAVLEQAGDGSVGRPHIATALVEKGLIDTYREAFDRFIGVGRPAYERKFRLSPVDAIKLISSAGGLSFLAHPGKYTTDDMLDQLIKAGLDGIETVHPSHSAETTAHYRGVVSEYFLLESGGSDFHGGKRNDDDAFGAYTIDGEKVDAMRRRLFAHKAV